MEIAAQKGCVQVCIVSAYTGHEGQKELTEKFVDHMLLHMNGNSTLVLVNAGGEPVNRDSEYFVRLDLKENHSFSRSMNTGIKYALDKLEPEYICIIGNDGFPDSEFWLEELIAGQKTTLAWISCPVADVPHYRVYDHLLLTEGQRFSNYRMYPAICWLLPSWVIHRIGLFDERFLGGTYEDNDYCLRVLGSGGFIILDKKVTMKHLLSRTIGHMDVSKMMQDNERRFREKWEA